MSLGKCVEQVIERSPVSVRVRGALERGFAPAKVARGFADNALLPYPRELTVAQSVGLRWDLVVRLAPTVGAWDTAPREDIRVTRQAG